MNLHNNITADFFNNKNMSKLHLTTYVNVYRHLQDLLHHLKKENDAIKETA